MSELYLGIEIGDEYSLLSRLDPLNSNVQNLTDEEDQIKIPSAICLDTTTSEISCGEEALRNQGKSKRVVFNKLESMFHSSQSFSVADKSWHVDFLLQGYLEYLLMLAKSKTGEQEIASLTICLDHVTIGESDRIRNICMQAGIAEEHVHIINKQEALMYFLLSNKSKEIWHNTCYLFDYSRDGLWVYETKVMRGVEPAAILINREQLKKPEELKLPAFCEAEEMEELDSWLAAQMKDMLNGRIVSSVFLSGEGFTDYRWAEKFIREIRAKKTRKVFQTEYIYTMGAALSAYHIAGSHKSFPFHGICEGRTIYSVSMELETKGKPERLVLLKSGISCNEAKASVELSVIQETELTFYVRRIDEAEKKKLLVKLPAYTDQEKERTRIRVSLANLDQETMLLRIEDLGFGEIFPSTGDVIQKKYDLKTLKVIK